MIDLEKALRVDDIFASLQGESKTAGYPTTFIRLYGCNIRCAYCDQPQDFLNTKLMTLKEIKDKVVSLGINRVCITGGEPLKQSYWKELAEILGENGCEVSIETNGCLPIPIDWGDYYYYRPRFVMDVKTPSSGMTRFNVLGNIHSLCYRDEIKFVLSDEVDLRYALDVLERFQKEYPKNGIPPRVVFSPVINDYFKEEDQAWARSIADFLIEKKMDYVCLQIQFHKVIGIK